MAVPVDTYVDNTATVVPPADYGLKVAKAGFDALTAADNDLLFNSSWPSLQEVSITAVSSSTTSFAHNMPYPPLALLFPDNQTGTGGDFLNTMKNCTVNDTNVYVSINGTGKVVVYNLDISTDVDYTYSTKTAAIGSYDPNYGVKMVKSGLSIDSNDLRDYIIHSRCGAPLVLAIKNNSTSSPSNPTVVQYTQELGYPVFVFGYVKAGASGFAGAAAGDWISSPLAGQAYPKTFTDGTVSYLLTSTPNTVDASLVILRTPMFPTTNSVSITI